MRTVIETPIFQRQAEKIWSEDKRFEFIAWIATHPEAGDVIPGADGARKVRWGCAGHGKRGGVRVIYFKPRRGRNGGAGDAVRQGRSRQCPLRRHRKGDVR